MTNIFIAGCDRTGTHLLAKILDTSPDIVVNQIQYENEPYYEHHEFFQRSIAMARNPARRPALMADLIRLYKQAKGTAKYFADKSHPNLWHYNALSAAFPDARWFLTDRNPFATVLSMIMHTGCVNDLAWSLAYPTPCGFMGKADERYHERQLPEQLALKWKAHHDLIQVIRNQKNARYVGFEDMVLKPAKTVKGIAKWLGVELSTIPVDESRVHYWKAVLTDEIKAAIATVVD